MTCHAPLRESASPPGNAEPTASRSNCTASDCYSVKEYQQTSEFVSVFTRTLSSLTSDGNWGKGRDICATTGVTCAADGVRLLLPDFGLQGRVWPLATYIDGSAVLVREMDLRDNPDLMGGVGGWWELFPALFYIAVANTSFSGTLPPAWRDMPHLHTFDAHHTQLSGTLPEEWAEIESLLHLSLHGTGVNGTLPMSWGSMTQLETLLLNATDLSGTIPAAWGRLRGLKRVNLSATLVTGCLPWEWVCEMGLSEARVGLLSSASSACPTAAEMCGTSSTASLPVWAAAVIAVGSFVLIAAVVGVVVICCVRRRRRRALRSAAPPASSDAALEECSHGALGRRLSLLSTDSAPLSLWGAGAHSSFYRHSGVASAVAEHGGVVANDDAAAAEPSTAAQLWPHLSNVSALYGTSERRLESELAKSDEAAGVLHASESVPHVPVANPLLGPRARGLSASPMQQSMPGSTAAAFQPSSYSRIGSAEDIFGDGAAETAQQPTDRPASALLAPPRSGGGVGVAGPEEARGQPAPAGAARVRREEARRAARRSASEPLSRRVRHRLELLSAPETADTDFGLFVTDSTYSLGEEDDEWEESD